MPAPRPTALNPSAPTIAAPAAIFFRYIAKLPSPTPCVCNVIRPRFMPTVSDLVQSTTNGGSPTHLRAAPTGTVSGPAKCSWVTKPASVTAAATQPGRAASAMGRCTGHHSTLTARRLKEPATVRISTNSRKAVT
jgi:hypothetical protein